MTINKHFLHQDYAYRPAPESYQLLKPDPSQLDESADFAESLSDARDRFIANGIRRIILVHGTMVGTDALGWYGHWERVFPWFSRKMKRTYKKLVDTISGDRGNYDEGFLLAFRNGMTSSDVRESIAVDRLEWTGENHHLGRADAAVKLCHRLLDCHEANERVMLWGHSHAGNVFAIGTQLLQASYVCNLLLLSRFFHASSFFHEATGRIDLSEWDRLHARLVDYANRREAVSPAEVVTFGTPIRYGWPEPQRAQLHHFVNHETSDNSPLYRGQWPINSQQWVRSIKGEAGDFIQLAFIAGSDFPPAYWSRSAWRANRWLGRLFERSYKNRDRSANLRNALRVGEHGYVTLVDYGNLDPRARECCGHSIYTDARWLTFHANCVAQRI